MKISHQGQPSTVTERSLTLWFAAHFVQAAAGADAAADNYEDERNEGDNGDRYGHRGNVLD